MWNCEVKVLSATSSFHLGARQLLVLLGGPELLEDAAQLCFGKSEFAGPPLCGNLNQGRLDPRLDTGHLACS